MSWNEYLRRVAGDVGQAEIALAAGVTAPTVSRWLKGSQGVDPVAAANFARHYRRPVLEAFVAAGFLTAEEAKARPTLAPDLSHFTNDQLLDLVRSRMVEADASLTGHGEISASVEVQQGRGGDGDDQDDDGRGAAPTKPPSPDDEGPGSVAASLPTIGQRERRVGQPMRRAARKDDEK